MKRLLAVLLLVLSCGGPSRVSGAGPAIPDPVPLAEEHSLALDPAVSNDGRWLAFASDGGRPGVLRLWLRPLAGGSTRQLTADASDAREPSFSPDGNILAYRGESGGGGVYLLRLDGSPPRLLASGGRRPRFSPDDRRIAYHSATGLFLIDVEGGQPRRIHASASDAAWSPDGKHLIFNVCSDAATGTCDWWVGPADGGTAVAVGAARLFKQVHLSGQPSPDLWVPSGNSIVFAGKTVRTCGSKSAATQQRPTPQHPPPAANQHASTGHF